MQDRRTTRLTDRKANLNRSQCMAADMSTRIQLRLLALALPFALAACGSANPSDQNLDALDAELTNSTSADEPAKDPALMSALQDQIMVDPALAQQSNADAVRPGGQPYSAQVPADGIASGDKAGPDGPLMKTPDPKADCPGCDSAKGAVTLGGLAARQQGNNMAQCVGGLRYSATWAARMPEALPVYPQARLVEAAGNDRNGCALRAATFVTGVPLNKVLDWYYTRTTSAGYQSEHQAKDGEHVLGGTRDRDNAAFILFAKPRDGGGTEIDLIVNDGR